MRDAIGGVVNVAFIAVFLVIVSGYLAFSVSYNKAFKVKNKIISVLEEYEYYNSVSKGFIDEYLKNIGYNADNPRVGTGEYDTCEKGYCIKWVQDDNSSTGLPRGHYRVMTAVYVDVPIFNKFLPFMNFLQVSGDTKSIYISQSSATR